MKRFICLIFAIILSIACFGCETEHNDQTEPDGTTQQPTEDIVIAKGTEPTYKIVRYIDATAEEVDLVVDFKNDLKEKHGISFTLASDWNSPTDQPPADVPEIIVGLCDRDAVRNVIEELNIGCGECAVRVCDDNKIVIMAPDYSDLEVGFEYFIDNLKVNDSSELVYTGGNYFSETEGDHIFSDITKLDELKIIYDKAGKNKSLAEDIASAFKKKHKVELDVICETEPKTSSEIIVGKLSDQSRFDFDFSKLSDLNYQIVSSNDSILLAAKSNAILKTAVKIFIDKFVKSGNPVSMNLKANNTLTYDTFPATPDTVLAEGADTRIMSFNILSEEWDSAAVMEGRDIRVSSVLLNYHPDVVALQEVSNKWYTVFDNYINHVYKFTRRKIPSGSGTYTTLAFNSETTRLIEEGIHLYSQGNSKRLRSIVWGVFESIATGKRYIVCSTHWDASAGGPAVRLVQAKEMADFVKTMRSKYGLDVFVCGDYNAKEGSTEYSEYIKNSGFVDAKTDAKTVKIACNTYHKLFSELNKSSYESIDHITFAKESAEKVLFYNTLYHDYIIDASDHCPIFIDIKLGK